MHNAKRWLFPVGLSACAAGAVAALFLAAPQPSSASAPSSEQVPGSARTDVEQANATRQVVDAANSLSSEIEHAKTETSTVLASSYSSLARAKAAVASERAQLEAEQAQIGSESQQLSARASALTAEGAALQQQAAALRAAEAQFASMQSAASANTQSRTYSGESHDD
jgi:chromosome segregation ATPase